jgi:hypothetical protein
LADDDTLPGFPHPTAHAALETPRADKLSREHEQDSWCRSFWLCWLECGHNQCRTKFLGQLSSEQLHRRLIEPNDNIVVVRTELSLLLTETFPDSAPQSITLNGAAFDLEREAQPEVTQFIGNTKDNSIPQARDFAAFEESQELLPLMKSKRVRKGKRSVFRTGRPAHKNLLSSNFRGELLAALRTTPLDHRLA